MPVGNIAKLLMFDTVLRHYQIPKIHLKCFLFLKIKRETACAIFGASEGREGENYFAKQTAPKY